MAVQKGSFRSARKSLNWKRRYSTLPLVKRLQRLLKKRLIKMNLALRVRIL
jgi:hypothetical protein